MTEIIAHADGELHITDIDNGLRRVTVKPSDAQQFIAVHSCETAYPTNLIEKILAVKGIAQAGQHKLDFHGAYSRKWIL